MNILSDFDGVLTDIADEARRVRSLFCATLQQHGGLDESALDRVLRQAERALAEHPHQHGWRQQGRMAAYADEDLFMANVGLANCLDDFGRVAGSAAAQLAQGLRTHQIASFNQVSQDAYQAMAEETRRGHQHPIDPEAVETLRRLLEAGHRVVVVSNSSTTRILDLLQRHGFDPQDHVVQPAAPLRVRGDARKFNLGEVSQGFWVDGYWIETARPTYEAILREERPGMVIGDVFSLDLGLPLFLARTEPEHFGGLRVCLRQRPYTPDWSRAFMTRTTEPHCTLSVIDSMRTMLELV